MALDLDGRRFVTHSGHKTKPDRRRWHRAVMPGSITRKQSHAADGKVRNK
jgi:hypothetical protein